MAQHGPHDEETSFPSPDWEWIGPDGLTNSRRDALTDEEKAVRELGRADMLPRVMLEEIPS